MQTVSDLWHSGLLWCANAKFLQGEPGEYWKGSLLCDEAGGYPPPNSAPVPWEDDIPTGPKTPQGLSLSWSGKAYPWLCPGHIQYPGILYSLLMIGARKAEWKWGDLRPGKDEGHGGHLRGNDQAAAPDCPVNGCPDTDQRKQQWYQHPK